MDQKQNQSTKKRGEKSPKVEKQVRVEGKAKGKKSFMHGDVVTTIFANDDGHGGLAFRIVQSREYIWLGKPCYAASFRPRDLVDMARGAMEANRLMLEWQRNSGRRRPFAWS